MVKRVVYAEKRRFIENCKYQCADKYGYNTFLCPFSGEFCMDESDGGGKRDKTYCRNGVLCKAVPGEEGVAAQYRICYHHAEKRQESAPGVIFMFYRDKENYQCK